MIGGDLRKRWRATVWRVAWGRRLEMGLVLITWAARHWLSHQFGPAVAFAVVAMGAGALVCAAPSREWLLDHTRGEMIERWLSRALAHTGLRDFDGGIYVAESCTVPGGVALTVLIPEGTTVEQLTEGSEALAVTMGARDVQVRRDRAMAGRAEITVLYDDPLAGAEVRWPWADAWQTLLWQGLPFGVDEQGRNVQLGLVGHNLLIGGEPGSGKSNALALIVGAAALDPDVQLWLFDGERTELACWRYSARRYCGSIATEATASLDELRALVTQRHEMLEAQKLHQVTPDMDLDLVLIVISELAGYLHGTSDSESAFADSLLDLVARGRTAGVIVVAVTDNQTSEVVPAALSEWFDYRLALRCATREASDTLLRSGWPPASTSASEIDPATPGAGLLLADKDVPRRMRCYRLKDDDLQNVIERATEVRAGD
jgi:S-DNA-T family DNA segregation ATPase FtsK/SpoIIIE